MILRTLMAAGAAALFAWTVPAAHAQAIANPQPLALQATTSEGSPFDLGRLKGKVALVFFWSTKCGVCLSHLPELRANLQGWRNKPFELVTVNVDNDMAEWRSYEKIANTIQQGHLTSVWANKTAAPKLPLTLVVDAQGRVVARHEGRIALEAWDAVAAMLP